MASDIRSVKEQLAQHISLDDMRQDAADKREEAAATSRAKLHSRIDGVSSLLFGIILSIAGATTLILVAIVLTSRGLK